MIAKLGALLLTVAAVGWGSGARGDEMNDAREHYRKATKAYELGLFDEAIREFTEAYKAKDDPTILFNLAQSQRLAGHRADALRSYRMFLLKVPDAPNRQEVEALLANLEKNKPNLDDPDSELARRYFAVGAERYEAKDYAAAVAEFEKARLVKQSPAIDFNIARANDRLGHTDGALTAYRRYLRSNPNDGDEIRARIAVLEQRQLAEKAAPPPAAALVVAATPPVEHGSGRAKTIAGIAIGVVGVALIGGGIASGILAKKQGDDLTKIDQEMGRFVLQKQSAGKNDQLAEGVLLGVGGAAAVTGAILLAVGRHEARRARFALRPTLAPGTAGISLAGSFR